MFQMQLIAILAYLLAVHLLLESRSNLDRLQLYSLHHGIFIGHFTRSFPAMSVLFVVLRLVLKFCASVRPWASSFLTFSFAFARSRATLDRP